MHANTYRLPRDSVESSSEYAELVNSPRYSPNSVLRTNVEIGSHVRA